jgi:hypothetical protein
MMEIAHSAPRCAAQVVEPHLQSLDQALKPSDFLGRLARQCGNAPAIKRASAPPNGRA